MTFFYAACGNFREGLFEIARHIHFLDQIADNGVGLPDDDHGASTLHISRKLQNGLQSLQTQRTDLIEVQNPALCRQCRQLAQKSGKRLRIRTGTSPDSSMLPVISSSYSFRVAVTAMNGLRQEVDVAEPVSNRVLMECMRSPFLLL